MNQFATDIINALVKKQDITEVFRLHLEQAVNTLLATELTAFLNYEKYDLAGFNSDNSAMVFIPVRCAHRIRSSPADDPAGPQWRV